MTPQTQYLLDKLQEEAAEVIQAVSKIRRFGPDNKRDQNSKTNIQELVSEIEDTLAVIGALEYSGLFNLTLSHESIANKLKQLIQKNS